MRCDVYKPELPSTGTAVNLTAGNNEDRVYRI
jgi:hypothetical protein